MFRCFRKRCDLDEVSTVLGDEYAIVRNSVKKDRVIASAWSECSDVDHSFDVVTSISKSVQNRTSAAVLIEQKAHDASEARCGDALPRLPQRSDFGDVRRSEALR